METNKMTDIEKTTISVRSFAVSMWTVVIIGGALIATGAYSAASVSNKASEILNNQADVKLALAAQTDANKQLTQQMIVLSQQEAVMQKRLDDYRPFKWSTPMQTELDQQIEQLNPQLKMPSAQAVHDELLPYTP